MLADGYNPDAVGGWSGESIAHVAAALGHNRVLKKLIRLGASIDRKSEGHTPLWRAAAEGNIRGVRVLLEAGADPDGLDDDGSSYDSPLCAASDPEIVRVLLDAGADPAIRAHPENWGADELADGVDRDFHLGDELMDPLARAAVNGREKVVAALLASGIAFDLDAALRFAAGSIKDSPEIIDILLKAGADPDGREGLEPLCVAARAGNRMACEKLLYPAGKRLSDGGGADNFASFLLSRKSEGIYRRRPRKIRTTSGTPRPGAKPNPRASVFAIKSGSLNCAMFLLEAGAGDPVAAVYWAARYGREEILWQLLGRWPEARKGLPLHGAARGLNLGLIPRLLEMGFAPDARDSRGMTALGKLYALDRRLELWEFYGPEDKKFRRCYWLKPDDWNERVDLFEDAIMTTARSFLERGADPLAVDNMGRRPLWHAARNSYLKSIPWLAGLGGRLEDRDRDGVSAFEAGCLSGEYKTLLAMLELGYDLNAQDENGDTALMKIARERDKRRFYWFMLSGLLAKGSDPDIKNKAGESFRDMARKDEELREILENEERERN